MFSFPDKEVATTTSQGIYAYFYGFLKSGRIFWFVNEDILWREEGLFEVCVSLTPPGIRCQRFRSRRCLLGRMPVKDKGEGEQE